MTEEEQIDAIKKWWKRYNTLITLVFSLSLLCVSGYKYWIWHQEKIKTQASNAYEHLMVAFSNKDNKRIKSFANQLINEYGESVYAHAARITLAKLYVARDKLDKAREYLEYVVNNAPMKSLKQVARIRIARIYAAQQAYNKALQELSSLDDSSYIPVVNELKGDIYAATGKFDLAIVAYKQAISEVQIQGIGNLYLEMKTNELAGLANSVTITKDSANTV